MSVRTQRLQLAKIIYLQLLGTEFPIDPHPASFASDAMYRLLSTGCRRSRPAVHGHGAQPARHCLRPPCASTADSRQDKSTPRRFLRPTPQPERLLLFPIVVELAGRTANHWHYCALDVLQMLQ